ncbi:MAG: hypothetical protein ABL921_08475 [Pirellula sp.]
MKIKKHWSSRIQSLAHWSLGVSLAFSPIVLTGCRGTPFSLPESLGGIGGASSRVPPPATGSFQVPQSYSGPNANNSGLGSSSFAPNSGTTSATGFKTSQVSQPVSNFVSGISAAQSQLRTATNNALNTVNRTAQDVNSTVENATARVDRFGEGIVQASAILNDAASAPLLPAASDTAPANGVSASGRIGDNPSTSAPSAWRTPAQP